MAELTVSQIIKLILGMIVVVAVVAGAGLFFKNNVIGFFDGIGDEENSTGSGEVNLSDYAPEKQAPQVSPVLVKADAFMG